MVCHRRIKELLGVEVPSDKEGVLQDVHWGVGAVGYFPSYSLGAMAAAQLYEAAAQLYEAAKAEMPSLEQELAQASGVMDSAMEERSMHDEHPPILTLALLPPQRTPTHNLQPTGPLPAAPPVAAGQRPRAGLAARVARRPPRVGDGQAAGPHVLRPVPPAQVRGAVRPGPGGAWGSREGGAVVG